MSFILISAVTLILSIILFKKAAGTLSIFKINMISLIFYYQLVLQCFIGVNIAIFRLDNHYLLSKITDSNIRLIAYLSVMYVMIMMPLSMVLFSLITKFKSRKEFFSYVQRPIKSIMSKYDSAVYYTMCFFSAISFISILYTFFVIGKIPLLDVLSGKDSLYLAQLRISVSRDFGGNVYIRNILALGLTPFLSYIAYSYYKMYSIRRWKLLFIFLFICSFFAYTYNLEKAPVLMYIISFLFLNVLIKGNISKRVLLIVVIVVFILITFMYIALGGIANLADLFSINSGPIGRIILGQITPLFYHFDIFPRIEPFLYGRSFPQSILSLFDVESIRSARIVMSIINPQGIEAGTAGVMNTLFIGEAYANFGWLGVMIGTLYVGFFIQFVYILFLRLPKNPLTLGLFTYFSVKIPSIVTGGFVDFIYNAGFITIVILAMSFLILSMILKRGAINPNKMVLQKNKN